MRSRLGEAEGMLRLVEGSEVEATGWYRRDWREARLTRAERSAAIQTMASLHAASLAHR